MKFWCIVLRPKAVIYLFIFFFCMFFVAGIGICNDITLDNIVFFSFMSISFHWLVPTFVCLLNTKRHFLYPRANRRCPALLKKKSAIIWDAMTVTWHHNSEGIWCRFFWTVFLLFISQIVRILYQPPAGAGGGPDGGESQDYSSFLATPEQQPLTHGVCAIRSLPAQSGLCWHPRTLPAQ